jgi:hypothetical protein
MMGLIAGVLTVLTGALAAAAAYGASTKPKRIAVRVASQKGRN